MSQSIAPSSSHTLHINKPSWTKRDSEFRQDTRLVGELTYTGALSQICHGRLHEQEVSFERQGLLRNQVVITRREFDSAHIASTLGRFRFRVSKLENTVLLEGKTYLLRANLFKNEWKWLSAEGEELAAYHISFLGDSGSLVFHPSYVGNPTMLLLAMLGWYLIQETRQMA